MFVRYVISDNLVAEKILCETIVDNYNTKKIQAISKFCYEEYKKIIHKKIIQKNR